MPGGLLYDMDADAVCLTWGDKLITNVSGLTKGVQKKKANIFGH